MLMKTQHVMRAVAGGSGFFVRLHAIPRASFTNVARWNDSTLSRCRKRTSLSYKPYSNESLDEGAQQLDVDPYGTVDGVMSVVDIASCTADEPVAALQGRLEHFHAVPVLDPEGHVVGIITRADVTTVSDPASTTVAQAMSRPAVCVRPRARVAQCAALMLANKYHTLPVTDASGRLVGLVSRSDIMRPLLQPEASEAAALLAFSGSHNEAFWSLSSGPEADHWHFPEKKEPAGPAGQAGPAPAPHPNPRGPRAPQALPAPAARRGLASGLSKASFLGLEKPKGLGLALNRPAIMAGGGPSDMSGMGGEEGAEGADRDKAIKEKIIMEGIMEESEVPRHWTVAYLYDGGCPMCQALKKMLQRADKKGSIAFINVANPDYQPDPDFGFIPFDVAMQKIHAVRRTGEVLLAKEAIDALYDACGLGWAAAASRLPGLSSAATWAVDTLSKNRFMITGTSLDAVLALRKAREAEAGPCKAKPEDEECEVPADLYASTDESLQGGLKAQGPAKSFDNI